MAKCQLPGATDENLSMSMLCSSVPEGSQQAIRATFYDGRVFRSLISGRRTFLKKLWGFFTRAGRDHRNRIAISGFAACFPDRTRTGRQSYSGLAEDMVCQKDRSNVCESNPSNLDAKHAGLFFSGALINTQRGFSLLLARFAHFRGFCFAWPKKNEFELYISRSGPRSWGLPERVSQARISCCARSRSFP